MERSILRRIRMCLSWSLLFFASNTALAQNVTVSVNATQDKRLISPYIYGRNESFDKSVQFYKDAGLRFARLNGGNNASAYNWRRKLDVHPDWYNNVYSNDWDALAQKINTSFPNMQGMFAFQLLGRVASNSNNNFNDWAYNMAQSWSGTGQNLAGGGVVNTNGGGQALVDGNIDLFSKPWPADSSVAILDHWFGANGKGFNKNQFVYWNMDNEVDIWFATHDWAMPTQLSASAFMDRYIELAKKAKALYPGIKLCGPVATSEWFWYKWQNENIYINGRYYPWIEYFIKRLGDEYKATGIKLVDVLDIHNYPSYNNDAEALQGHRIYYDETYDYPGSNGIKGSAGGWDASLSKQYIFKRIDGWLNEHFGTNHGITAGLSEWGTMTSSNPSLESVVYASHLGTFANNGVELFSPWIWSTGMWETLHLFRNAKKYSVSSTSSLENTVSAYSSINENSDSLTVMLVNRDMSASRTVTINLNNFNVANGTYKTLQLSSLPATETFVSHTQNALKANTVTANSNSLTITVPALSTTAILLTTPVTYTLSTTVVPTAGGTVTGAGTYNSGTAATVTAIPAAGYTFTGWSGDASGTATSIAVTMNSNKSVTANFQAIKYTLTTSASPVAGGTVTGAGTYNSGTAATVTAIPATGYTFTGWSGDASGTAASITVTMNNNKSVTANFQAINYALTTTTSPVAGGTVSGAGMYKAGANATVTAIPATGYIFTGWSGDASGTAASITVTMDGDKSVMANFQLQSPATKYTLTTTTSPTAGGAVSGAGTYDAGTEVIITATAAPGYTFTGWSGDISGTSASLSVTLSSDVAVQANFQRIEQFVLKIPKLFSPDNHGDIITETWGIENAYLLDGCEITIYDRQGQKVYTSLGYAVPWDGASNGRPLPDGAYFYVILYPDNKKQTGSVTIARLK